MAKIIFIIAIIACVTFFQSNDNSPGSNDGSTTRFFIPDAAAGERKGSGIKKYEFNTLFEQNKSFESLAKENYYTVIEGYIDSCLICKNLEADFPDFLTQRKDVLIRKVHFPEGSVSQSFSGNSEEEMRQQMADYYDRFGSYNFNQVVKTNTEYQLKVCGTPHVEIYGLDKQLIVTDKCGEKNMKSGLAFLKKWMKSE